MAEPIKGGGGPAPAPVERARGAVMREKCLERRITGMTYQQIGDEFGISRQAVHQHVKKALENLAAKEALQAERIRQMELLRLDALLRTHWLTKGEADSGRLILEIGKRRARLEGLDAPTKVEATGKDGSPLHPPAAADVDLENLTVEELEQLQALLAKAAPKPTP